MTKYPVSEKAAGERLDHFLASAVPELSRNQIQRLIDSQQVMVGGAPVKKSYRVQSGDVIELALTTEPEPDYPKQDLPLDILYEDDWIALINKPKGMVVHPAPGRSRDTLVNALKFHFDALSRADSFRPGIVHRMDKDTTGLILVTKTDASYDYFQPLFQRNAIERTYWTLVHGAVNFLEKTIDAPIGRHPKQRTRYTVREGGKAAQTIVKTLAVYPEHSFLECRLITGRTHQIRVHLESIQHPIVGDPVYGRQYRDYIRHGPYLHARRLSFVHPNGERMSFEAELPPDFQQRLVQLANKD